MDIGAASAISSYSYQTNVQSGTQGQAVLRALTQAYTSASSANSGLDPITAMVGTANLRPLVSAIYTQAKATQTGDGSGTNAIPGLAPSQTYGGLEASSANALLATLASGSSSLSGFEAALGASSTLALTAYQNHQTAGTALPAAPPAGADSATQAAYIQQVLLASQTNTNAATFNLLG